MKIDCTVPAAFRTLFEPHRYKVFYGGRGGAKSWAFAQALLIEGVRRPCRVLCAREIQNSIRDSVKRLLDDWIERLGLRGFYKSTDFEIRGKNGTLFIFSGLNMNAEKIKSFEGLTHCWLEEAETVSERSFDLLVPTMRTAGSEIWISFNPAAANAVIYQRFVINTPPPDSVVKKVTFRDNPYFPDVLRKEMEYCREHDPDKYDHVWEGNPARITKGSYYARILADSERDGKITAVPYNPAFPVVTAWDLGFSDSTAIWFAQIVGREVHVADFYQASGAGLDHYVKVLKEKGYLYGEHLLPHDAGASELGTGTTRLETLRRMGINGRVLPMTKVDDGINAVRMLLPRCYFDTHKTAAGLEALRMYQREYDDKMQDFKPRPLHDWTSHAADAFRYLAMGLDQTQKDEFRPLKYKKLRVC